MDDLGERGHVQHARRDALTHLVTAQVIQGRMEVVGADYAVAPSHDELQAIFFDL